MNSDTPNDTTENTIIFQKGELKKNQQQIVERLVTQQSTTIAIVMTTICKLWGYSVWNFTTGGLCINNQPFWVCTATVVAFVVLKFLSLTSWSKGNNRLKLCYWSFFFLFLSPIMQISINTQGLKRSKRKHQTNKPPKTNFIKNCKSYYR